MPRRRLSRVGGSVVPLLVVTAAVSAADAERAAWRQWGGPTQDFHAPAGRLAARWPEGGPAKLWQRPLGDGYSAVLVEDGRLYTMHRVGDEEAVACLDAVSGETVWEFRYRHGPLDGFHRGFGDGPRATPLLSGDLLFTVGVAGKMHALRKLDGKPVWSRDLWDGELGGNVLGHGYASSPVTYRDTVIVAVGGEHASLVALDRADGRVRWKTLDFDNSYSSPRVLEILGEPQLVVFMADELIGVRPDDGALRWRYAHANQWRHNVHLPAVAGGDTVVLSSPQIGSRGLRLSRDGERIEVEEVWSERRVQFYHGSTVRLGDWVYGSSGVTSPALMTAVSVRTGEIGWRERGFATANCVAADGKLVILDQDGVLTLAEATPEKLAVLARTQLVNEPAWTVPTIVGDTLYLRTFRTILAVDLGQPASSPGG